MKVKITFIEELLGTCSGNAEIHREFISAMAPDAATREEEIKSLGADAVEKKGMTVFPRENGIPFLYDYQWKGYFKDCCGMLRRADDTESAKLKAFKKEIDGLIFVKPRKCMLVIPDGGVIGKCERPLRGQTAQGERISLAASETVPAGTICEFEIKLLSAKLEKVVIEWLDYGELHGTGCWRNSGKGRFNYVIL
jgi:hypothetical protein